MARRPRYDVDARWDDPWERRAEQRAARRFPARLKVWVIVERPEAKGRVVGPAVIENMSLSGLFGVTKHELAPGQRILVGIRTDRWAPDMCLPEVFEGAAEVVRVDAIDERQKAVGLRLGNDFIQNMEFAMFVDYLESMSSMMTA